MARSLQDSRFTTSTSQRRACRGTRSGDWRCGLSLPVREDGTSFVDHEVLSGKRPPPLPPQGVWDKLLVLIGLAAGFCRKVHCFQEL